MDRRSDTRTPPNDDASETGICRLDLPAGSAARRRGGQGGIAVGPVPPKGGCPVVRLPSSHTVAPRTRSANTKLPRSGSQTDNQDRGVSGKTRRHGGVSAAVPLTPLSGGLAAPRRGSPPCSSPRQGPREAAFRPGLGAESPIQAKTHASPHPIHSDADGLRSITQRTQSWADRNVPRNANGPAIPSVHSRGPVGPREAAESATRSDC
jgi:hypothetical protein